MHVRPIADLGTHEVTNQPPPIEGLNRFSADPVLGDALARSAASGAAITARLSDFGARVGSEEVQGWVVDANRHKPEFRPFDRYGHRLDEVEFHPAYHNLMALGLEAGVSAAPLNEPGGGHTVHSALMFLMMQADAGVTCPMSMTYAAAPALAHAPELDAAWRPRIAAARYDPRFIPAPEKAGVTIGMAMTEKQGGSDVRANTTRAEADGAGGFILTGHKWFCSAPMSDAFLTLAYEAEGLSCFLVPRWRPDGTRNAIRIQRLKDKLGDHSNASSEIEYHGAFAERVGAPGRGVRTIIEMVQGTRLDCAIGSAGLMRAALVNAAWHVRHRTAFQKRLIDQPAMAEVIAELAVESEAATRLAFRVARTFDGADAGDAEEAALKRLITPLAKYWICKRTPNLVYEAMECHGGAGYVEEGPMPRLFRQSPLNSIWEGSGNVIALDLLRALGREADAVEALMAFLSRARGCDDRLDAAIDRLTGFLEPGALSEARARRFAEAAALAVQGALLAGEAPGEVFEAFAASRLGPERALTFGTADLAGHTALLAERALV